MNSKMNFNYFILLLLSEFIFLKRLHERTIWILCFCNSGVHTLRFPENSLIVFEFLLVILVKIWVTKATQIRILPHSTLQNEKEWCTFFLLIILSSPFSSSKFYPLVLVRDMKLNLTDDAFIKEAGF
jgi:hypothetical protein